MLLLVAGLVLPGCDQENPPQDNRQTQVQQPPAASSEHGEQLAQACFRCHPASGEIINRAYPQINGLGTGYLISALFAYQSGKRQHDDMQQTLRDFNAQDLKDLAAYYGSLATAWKKVWIVDSTQQQKTDPQLIAAGQALAHSCFSCHGETGNSHTQGVPSLAGLSQQYIISALQGYFQGSRSNEIMQVFKHAFDKDKITSLAAYFASQSRQSAPAAKSGNVAKGKKLASRRCIGCHGKQGNSLVARFPTLAGQNAGYLRQATLAYGNGKRDNELMKQAIAGLSQQDITNLAAYFAEQTPAVPDKPATRDSADPMQAAKSAATPCFGCHGDDGNSELPGTPNLSGLQPGYLKNAIQQYQQGDRQNALMKDFTQRLPSEELDLIATYFAFQDPKIATPGEKGPPGDVKEIIAGCEGCHGAKGVSTSKTPSIAGQDKLYLQQALLAYQSRQRASDEMQNAVKGLSKTKIKLLAGFFARQQAVKPDVRALQSARQLSEKCNRCHDVKAPNLEQPVAPRISGQSEPYLLKALNEYKTRSRDQSTMFAMLEVLNDWEIRDLARYYARLNSTDK